MQPAPDVGPQHNLSLKRHLGVSTISLRDFQRCIWVTNTLLEIFVGRELQF